MVSLEDSVIPHLYCNDQANTQAAKNRDMRKMCICSVQINSFFNKNAHIFRLSCLFRILFALGKSRFFLFAVHAGDNANALTLLEHAERQDI